MPDVALENECEKVADSAIEVEERKNDKHKYQHPVHYKYPAKMRQSRLSDRGKRTQDHCGYEGKLSQITIGANNVSIKLGKLA